MTVSFHNADAISVLKERNVWVQKNGEIWGRFWSKHGNMREKMFFWKKKLSSLLIMKRNFKSNLPALADKNTILFLILCKIVVFYNIGNQGRPSAQIWRCSYTRISWRTQIIKRINLVPIMLSLSLMFILENAFPFYVCITNWK